MARENCGNDCSKWQGKIAATTVYERENCGNDRLRKGKLRQRLFKMARENCGNDCSKWQGKIAATTVQNGKGKLRQRLFKMARKNCGNDRLRKGKLRQRLFKMARENCGNDCSKWQGKIAATTVQNGKGKLRLPSPN